MVSRSKEDCQMWLHIQTWLPLMSITLTAAICFGAASIVLGNANPQNTAHYLINQASVALVHQGIVATFAVFSLIVCVIWLLFW